MRECSTVCMWVFKEIAASREFCRCQCEWNQSSPSFHLYLYQQNALWILTYHTLTGNKRQTTLFHFNTCIALKTSGRSRPSDKRGRGQSQNNFLGGISLVEKRGARGPPLDPLLKSIFKRYQKVCESLTQILCYHSGLPKWESLQLNVKFRRVILCWSH